MLALSGPKERLNPNRRGFVVRKRENHMLQFFKDRMSDLQASASRYKDKETAEAIVAIMTGVAYADGELEREEKAKMAGAFRINPILSQFDFSVLTKKFDELSNQCEFDADVGLDACIKELKDVGSNATMEKRITIMRLGVASAKADGEIEDKERQFLARCGEVLGVQLSDVGL